MTSQQRNDKELPVWRVVTLCIINFNESLQGNIVWPILAYAVQRWGATDEDIGLYVGLLASSFFLAQCLFVAAWGKAADTFGRRPTLLVGLFGTALSMTLFGFARNFAVALLARFLTGALNGNVAIAKTYMGEITNSATQARAFAWLSFTWGFGGILAPALGGWLSEPAENYPSLFGHSDFFRSFPYVLPSLLSAAFSIAAFVFGYFALPETEAFLARKRSRESTHARVPTADDEDVVRVDIPEVVEAESDANGHDENVAPSRRRNSTHTDAAACNGIEVVALPPLKHLRTSQLQTAADASLGTPSKLPRHTTATLAHAAQAVVRAVQHAPVPVTTDSTHVQNGSDSAPAPAPVSLVTDVDVPVTLRDLVADHAVMACVGLYALLSFAQILFDELLPVFCKTSVAHGGLGFPSSRVGSLQVIAGATQITMQLGIIPIIVPRFGPINCFRYSMWPLVLLLFFPSVAYVADRPELLWPALALGIVIKTSMMSISFTSIMLLINNSSRGRGLGLINGLAQGVASGVRTVAPSVGGALFTASLTWMWLGGLRMHVVYALQTVALVAGALCSTTLPAWVNSAPLYQLQKQQPEAETADPEEPVTQSAGAGEQLERSAENHTNKMETDATETTDGAEESDAFIS